MKGDAPLRVLGTTAYPVSAASARVRVANYVPFLAEHGVELGFRSTLTDADYALLASSAGAPAKALALARAAQREARRETGEQLLLVHRLRLLGPFPGVDPPRRLDVYDLDDALFLGSAAAVNRRFQWVKQEARRAAACMRRARLVIAGNAFLAEAARRLATRVEVIPSCVDPTRQPLRAHAPADVTTIGWIGSQTTSQYLVPVLPALARINRKGLRARLVVIGGQLDVREPWLEQREWSLAREATDLATFDIGIMPLPDTQWARGKCGYKVLQYFAAGIPSIASPVGVNPQLLDEDRGILAATSEEWDRAFAQLLADPAERAQRGALAREFVEGNFSYQRWAPELAALLHSLT